MAMDTISALRQRMIEDMNLRKLGAHTHKSHIYSCKRFAAFLKRSPDTATLEDIRLFQLHLAETGMSICGGWTWPPRSITCASRRRFRW